MENFFLLREMVGDWRPPFSTALYIYIQNKFHLSQYCRLKSTLKLASHKNYAVFSFDLFADFVISLNDNLHILDFDVDADLVEWEPSIFKFIPNSSITVTHHLERERVEIEIDCGCTKLSSSWFVPIFLKGAVILIYCFRWATTQSSMSLIL